MIRGYMEERENPGTPSEEDARGRQLVRVGGPIDRATVSLRVFGDALDPTLVTELLGCEPTRSHRKGDVFKGKRSSPVARQGGWILKGGLPGAAEIEEQVVALLDHVTSDLEVWRRLTDGYKVDIFCGVFLEDWNRGFVLSPSVLKLLSDRRLELSFDIYGVTD